MGVRRARGGGGGGGAELPVLKRPTQRCCFPDKAAVGMCLDEAAHAAVTVEQCNEQLDTKRTCVSLSLAQCQYDSTCSPAVARRSLSLYIYIFCRGQWQSFRQAQSLQRGEGNKKRESKTTKVW